MNGKRTFTIVALGIADFEQRVFANIFKLSQHRPRTYSLTTFASNQQVDIIILDPANQEGLAVWRAYRNSSIGNQSVPTITVVHGNTALEGDESLSKYTIRRPFVATRVLNLLDEIAIKELKHIPERTIGGKAGLTNPVIETIKETIAPATTNYLALVVDDSRAVRKQIELELGIHGVQTDLAETGEQAFELLDQKTYDIIFLDVILPGVDGYKICRTIKKNRAKKHIPVIMLTSKSSPFDRVRGTFAGCDSYLTKPVAQASFQKVLKKYLS